MRTVLLTCAISGLLFAVACGGGGGNNSSNNSSATTPTGGTTPTTITSAPTSTAGNNTIATEPDPTTGNVAPLLVDGGVPLNLNYNNANVAYTTITLCSHGSTTNCTTIDHVMVDTGSVGLRILSSAVPAGILSQMPNVNSSNPIAACVQFGDNSFFWGSVRVADVRMGGTKGDGSVSGNNYVELASSLPIQVVGDPAVESLLSTASGCTGSPEENTVALLGAKGLLGVGNTQYDCDVPGDLLFNSNGSVAGTFGIGSNNPCSASSGNSTPPPASYYSCTSSACTASFATASQQIQNPVALFATDNNGVILELKSVPSGGASNVTGSLVFGIGTQANNPLSSSAVVLPVDTNYPDNAWLGFTTVTKSGFASNGTSYPDPNSTTYTGLGNFLDSGSTDIFFLDPSTTQMASCGSGMNAYYCPSSTQSFTVENEATTSSVGSIVSLLGN